MSPLRTLGNLKELLFAVEAGLLNIRESLDMHQFCAYWGAHDVLSYLQDCLCVVHGTAGCISNRRFLASMGSSEPCDLDPHYSTAFTDHDVIFGGEKRLAEALREAAARHDPALIAVITNCCADIIGDDVGGVVRSIPEVAKRTVWLHTGGFSGRSYRKGTEEAFAVLARVMEEAPAAPVKKGTVNLFLRRWIWGETQRKETEEAVRLLSKLGLTVNQVMRKGIALRDFISMKEAEANVALCSFFGAALFEEMEKRFGTRTAHVSNPVGLTQTLAWMAEIARVTGRTYDPAGDPEVAELTALRAQVRAEIGEGRHALIWTQTGERMIGLARLATDVGLDPIAVGVDASIVREKIRMFRREVRDGFNVKVSKASTIEDVRELARHLDDPIVFCNDDYFPEHPILEHRYAQNPIYGLSGCRIVYGKLRDALRARRSRYSLVSQVVPA